MIIKPQLGYNTNEHLKYLNHLKVAIEKSKKRVDADPAYDNVLESIEYYNKLNNK